MPVTENSAKAKLTPDNLETALKTASQPYKGSTKIGHSFSKHAGRKPEIWGKTEGAMNQWHSQAMKHFREICQAEGNFYKMTNPRGISFLEKRLPDGRGIRLNMDYTFKGFID